MSKIVRKCPNCGATMPVDVKYCRKCHAKLDSGRVENLADSAQQQKKVRKRTRDNDVLHDLPRPVRPAEEAEENAAAAAGAAASGDGFFNPEYTERSAQKRSVRRPGDMSEDGPQPVSTARGAGERSRQPKRSDRNLWQIITVLAIIFVIIVVAIVLVIKLNQSPAGGNAQMSENFTPPVSATQEPSVSPMAAATATPVPTPTTAPATATPVPTPTIAPASPAPSATPAPNYTITGVNDTVYVINGPVNLRRGPGTEYEAITQASTGTALTRTGMTNIGWSRISYNGYEAFVANNYISSTYPSAATNPPAGNNNNNSSYTVTEASGTVTVATTSGANLRSGPGENYSVVATVAVGTQLTRTGTSGNWTRVNYNGQSLFISTSLLQGSYTGDNYSVTEDSGTGTVTGDQVNIRKGPGTGYESLGRVNKGTTLTITGKSGNWYRVDYNGQTGFISADYVSKS